MKLNRTLWQRGPLEPAPCVPMGRAERLRWNRWLDQQCRSQYARYRPAPPTSKSLWKRNKSFVKLKAPRGKARQCISPQQKLTNPSRHRHLGFLAGSCCRRLKHPEHCTRRYTVVVGHSWCWLLDQLLPLVQQQIGHQAEELHNCSVQSSKRSRTQSVTKHDHCNALFSKLEPKRSTIPWKQPFLTFGTLVALL